MKNKKFRESFKAINPTVIEKERILDNILIKQEKKAIPFNKLLPSLAFILIFILNINSTVNNANQGIAKTSMRYEVLTFTHNGKCYQESNILSNTDNLTRLGIVSKIENKLLNNVPIYKNRNGNIILEINDYYITFTEIDCFKNMKG